jgi:hypothetical protein
MEALADPQLPDGGPGAENGNYIVSEFALQRISDSGAAPQPLPFSSAVADYEQSNDGPFLASNMFDPAGDTGWAIYPQLGQSHVAILAVEAKRLAAGKLSVRIKNGTARWPAHQLGRFRISVTSDPGPYTIEQVCCRGIPASVTWRALQGGIQLRTGKAAAAEQMLVPGGKTELLKNDPLQALLMALAHVERGNTTQARQVVSQLPPLTGEPALSRLQAEVARRLSTP